MSTRNNNKTSTTGQIIKPNPFVYIAERQASRAHEPDIKIELESGQNARHAAEQSGEKLISD